jgi:tripartite-type tricarboxylate transporter receptor subunit TctC
MHPRAALVAETGPPPAALERLPQELRDAPRAAEVARLAEQAGFEITPSTPQALRERIAADTALYAPLVNEGRVARM